MPVNKYNVPLAMTTCVFCLVLLTGCAAPKVKDAGLLDSTTLHGETGEESMSPANAALLRGDAAFRHGDHDRALMEYLRAVDKDQDTPDAFCRIGRLQATQKNAPLAHKAYARALELNPEHADALEGMGLLLLEQRRYDEAGEYLDRAVTADPTRWRSHNGLGIRADLQGDPEAAAMHYEAALLHVPNSPLLLNNLGYSLYLAGEWEQAADKFHAAVTQDLGYAPAWRNLGLVYARQARFDMALKAFERVMLTAQAQNAVGYLCMLDGRYAEAERFFREAIRQSPSYYETARQNLARNTDLLTRHPMPQDN